MFAKRCAIAFILAAPLAVAEDAMWSGVSPDGSAFTGHADQGHQVQTATVAPSSDSSVKSTVMRTHSHRGPTLRSGEIAPAPVYMNAAPAETTEAPLSSVGGVLLLVAGVAGLAALAAYAMGYWPRSKTAQTKRRAVNSDVAQAHQSDPEETVEVPLVSAAAAPVVAMAAPLPAYQFAAPAAAPVVTYASAPAPVYATRAAPAYATPPAPAYYSAAPAVPAPSQPQFMSAAQFGTVPEPLPMEPLPVSYTPA